MALTIHPRALEYIRAKEVREITLGVYMGSG